MEFAHTLLPPAPHPVSLELVGRAQGRGCGTIRALHKCWWNEWQRERHKWSMFVRGLWRETNQCEQVWTRLWRRWYLTRTWRIYPGKCREGGHRLQAEGTERTAGGLSSLGYGPFRAETRIVLGQLEQWSLDNGGTVQAKAGRWKSKFGEQVIRCG